MRPAASFNPLALEELREAVAYYEGQGVGLGASLLEEVEKTVDLLQSHPESGQQTGRGIRRRVLNRFPYSLMYRLAGGDLRILALAHQRRRPRYWRSRS